MTFRRLVFAALGLAALASPSATLAQAPAPVATAPPARTLTLDQVVSLALNNNSTTVLARQRLRKAQELLPQVDAQTRPQVRADLLDTLSSQKTFGTVGGSAGTLSALPGGGQIPVVVDQGGGNTATFIGGGGGGTAPSTGTTGAGTTGTGAGTTGIGGTGTNGANGLGNGTNGVGGTGTNGTAPGTGGGTTGNGTTGGVGTGANFGGVAAPQFGFQQTMGLPPIARQYLVTTRDLASPNTLSRAALARANATDTTGSGGAGTGSNGNGGTGAGGTGTVSTGGFSTGSNGGHYNNYGARLSITQGVDLFGLVPAARDVERITQDFYAIDLDRVGNEVALSAKNTFFSVLRAQSQVAVDQEQVTAAQENVRIATARFNAGAAPQFDVLTAQTNLTNLQQQLSSARNSLALAQANLNNLLGLAPATPITLQEPPLPPLDQPVNVPQSTRTALARRPELREADNNIVIAQRLIKIAGATLKPSLGVSVGGNYNGYVSSGSPHETIDLSIDLGIPLYDGGATAARVRSAQVDLDTQVTTRAQLRQNVSLEVLQASLNVSDAQTRSASAGQGVTQALEALRLANVRYQNGIGTQLDVTNAQAQLATARTNLAGAQYDYQTALAQLTRAEGGR
ncbi:MAG: TolC family protein [Armatimonadota bacterium]|nr:TolC family protein [Armatimonadota bacterium]